MKKHQYHLIIACAGALWGMISIFFKFLSAEGLDKIQVVVLRFGFAAVLLCLWLAVRNPQALHLRRPWHLLYFIGTGIASQAFFNLCYYAAIERAGVAVAALLLYTAPAFVILFSRLLFGEKVTKGKAIALILTMAGCACMTGICSGGFSISPCLWAWFGHWLCVIFDFRQIRLTRLFTGNGYGIFIYFCSAWDAAISASYRITHSPCQTCRAAGQHGFGANLHCPAISALYRRANPYRCGTGFHFGNRRTCCCGTNWVFCLPRSRHAG